MYSPPQPRLDAILRRLLIRAGRIGVAVALIAFLILVGYVLLG